MTVLGVLKFYPIRLKIKVISAITVSDIEDVLMYKKYRNISDIILFDSKGYEKSLSFDHAMIKNINLNKELMIAGNIQYNDELKNYKNLANYIDLSGGIETSGLKTSLQLIFQTI